MKHLLLFLVLNRFVTATVVRLPQPMNISSMNSTNPSNRTVTALPYRPQGIRTLPLPPSDPYDLPVHGTGIIIEFYGYRHHLNYQSVLECCLAAYSEVLDHRTPIRSRLPLGTQTRTWSSDDYRVFLVLHPRAEMTWAMLWEAIPPLQWFCQNFSREGKCTQFQFLVLVEGVEGEVGVGEFSGG